MDRPRFAPLALVGILAAAPAAAQEAEPPTHADSLDVAYEVGREVGLLRGNVRVDIVVTVVCVPGEPCEPPESNPPDPVREAFRRGVADGAGVASGLPTPNIGGGVTAEVSGPRFSDDGRRAWVLVRIHDPWTREGASGTVYALERNEAGWPPGVGWRIVGRSGSARTTLLHPGAR